MNKNLGWKLIVIVATLLFFLFGIFGIPERWSGSGLLAAMQNRIHLGLDLKGGTHLILQVQVNDAVNVDSDNAVERLKADLRARKINYSEISKPDPANNPDKIVLKGVPPESRSDLLSIVQDRLPEYDLTSGADNTWTVSMKPQALADLKNRAVAQAIETIRNRIDQLGVSEPIIEEHGLGQYQILVQLPGVDDPARVKDIMQSTAMLEIRQSFGGPYPSEQEALQDKGGVLPPDQVLMPGGHSIGASDGGQAWYLISRASAVTGRDLRAADQSRDENGQPSVSFHSDRRRRPSFRQLHRRPCRRQSRRRARQQGAGSCHHQRPDPRSRRNQWALHRAASQRPGHDSAFGRLACRHQVSWRSAPSGRHWAAIRSAPE